MVLPDHDADTPVGKLLAVPIAVAPVVVCVIGVNAALIQSDGEEDAELAVLFVVIVTIQLPEDCVNEVLHVPSLAQRVYVVEAVKPLGGLYVALLLLEMSTPFACHL